MNKECLGKLLDSKFLQSLCLSGILGSMEKYLVTKDIEDLNIDDMFTSLKFILDCVETDNELLSELLSETEL